MNLHRSGKKPDWLSVPITKRNRWQRLAAGSHAVITPGNILTLAGFVLVVFGLWRLQYHEYNLAVLCIVVGRLCDLLDGIVADRTGTKSPLGESLDAGFDKLASLLALALLYTAHVISLPILILVLLPNIANVLVTLIAWSRHLTLHPSRYGKFSMAAAWVGLGSLVIAARDVYSSRYWLGIGYIAVGLCFALGMTAAIAYAIQVFAKAKSARP